MEHITQLIETHIQLLDLTKETSQQLMLLYADALFSPPTHSKLVNLLFKAINNTEGSCRQDIVTAIMAMYLQRSSLLIPLVFASAGPWFLIKELHAWTSLIESKKSHYIIMTCNTISNTLSHRYIISTKTPVDKLSPILGGFLSVPGLCTSETAVEMFPYFIKTLIFMLKAYNVHEHPLLLKSSLKLITELIKINGKVFVATLDSTIRTKSIEIPLNLDINVSQYGAQIVHLVWTQGGEWNILKPILGELLNLFFQCLPYLYDLLAISPGYSTILDKVLRSILTLCDSDSFPSIEMYIYQHLFHEHILVQWFSLDLWCSLITLSSDAMQLRYMDLLVHLVYSLEKDIYPSTSNNINRNISEHREKLRFTLLNIIRKVLVCFKRDVLDLFYTNVFSQCPTNLEAKYFLFDILPLPAYQTLFTPVLKSALAKVKQTNDFKSNPTESLLHLRAIKKLSSFLESLDNELKTEIFQVAIEKVLSSRLNLNYQILREAFGILLSLRSTYASSDVLKHLLDLIWDTRGSLKNETKIVLAEFMGIFCDSIPSLSQPMMDLIGKIFDTFFADKDWVVVEESLRHFQSLLSVHPNIFSNYIDEVCLYLDKKPFQSGSFELNGLELVSQQQSILNNATEMINKKELNTNIAKLNYVLMQYSKQIKEDQPLLHEISYSSEALRRLLNSLDKPM